MLTLTNRIDMRPGAVPLVIHLGQYDSDFSLVFELYSSAGNFTVESDTTAMIRGTKTDGNAYDADATIDISAKTVTVTGNEQMTAAKGRNVYELVLTKSGKVLSTANFILDVERAAMDADTIASESVLKELNAIIAGAATSTQAAADAATAADRAEDAADSVSSASAQIATNTSDIADLKADLSYYTEEAISVNASPEGWRLTGTGACTEATSYKLVKYLVTAGDLLHLTLSKDVMASEAEGVYQWQNTASVPSQLPNSGLIGTPVTEAVDGYVEVPTGATYLIVSQFKTNTTNKVMLVTDVETVKEKIEGLNDDVAELNEKIDDIEPGLSAEAKDALMACFAHVAWTDEHGQDYYDDLYNALYGVQPDPEVPNAYTRYDWIKLKKYSEVPRGTYKGDEDPETTGDNNVGVLPEGIIKTAYYANLNQLSFKVKVQSMPSSKFSNTVNPCPFGGGTASGVTSRLGLYVNIAKQWIYVMMHGAERQFVQTLNDVNEIEIINNSASPSTIKINGTSHTFEWANSNVINAPIHYFSAIYTTDTSAYRYASAFIRCGEIEITDINSDAVSKLIPVVRKSDNVIGIYDAVQKVFYTASDLMYTTIGNSRCIYELGNWS